MRKGVGRETAHEAIKEHAVAVALAMRERGQADNDLFDRLAADPRLSLSRAEIDALVADRVAFVGAAQAQVAAVVAEDREDRGRAPEGRSLRPRRDPLSFGEPEGHIPGVVRVLGRLDVGEKAGVDGRVAQRGDRAKGLDRGLGVAAGHRFAPQRGPVGDQRGGILFGQAFGQPQDVEAGLAPE